MPNDLKDKVIVITGASAGIGEATALACAEQGMRVVLAARREDRLNQLAQRIEQTGQDAMAVVCDVRDDAAVDALFEHVLHEWGRVDAVFANAGYGMFSSVLDTGDEELRDMFETNYFGTIRTVKSGVAAMRRSTGSLQHVLICSSAASEIAPPMYGQYAATKAAQDAAACAMRAELYREGIAVSSVHPIGTNTEFFDVVENNSPARQGDLILNTPASLMHSSEKVAGCVVKCLKRPVPEVWPSVGVRLGVAFTTALPRIAAWAMRRMVKERYQPEARPARTSEGEQAQGEPVTEQVRAE